VPYALTTVEDGILGQGVALVSSSVSLLRLYLLSAAKLYVSKFELNL
jgi:hypothetical protein